MVNVWQNSKYQNQGGVTEYKIIKIIKQYWNKGGITEYTITVSAIVGNAKMKGVTTKVRIIMMIIMFMMMMMMIIMIIMIMMMTVMIFLGLPSPLSSTKPHTSPIGLNA